ncbi:MAG: ABC transporter ATP-binding protein/permease [Phycisphaerales bacterium]|nr:ABC transporter ATP-binding protein/permease [Phycisphaerales bacterium]
MLFQRRSSRTRYRDYLIKSKDPAWAKLDSAEASGSREKKGKRSRGFFELFWLFWAEIRAFHGTIYAAIATVTVATCISLVMPASTLITIDYIVTDHPGPAGIPRQAKEVLAALGINIDPAAITRGDRVTLLWVLGAAMVLVSCVSVLIWMWGRWQMTRLTKRVQASMRKNVFEHAVRLPLHRVQQIKTGGMVSVLREDAGASAELLFSLIYNPTRAIVQLIGTLIILAVVDWRMLVGGLLLIPAVWLSHRTWISRIRPLFRDIRITRSSIDGQTTEAFGGMRVVRGFSRELSESGRFTRAGHFMSRQEILVWWWSRILEVLWSMLIPIASTGVLIYGGTQVIRGELTIGQVMMFTSYLLMLLSPLETLTNTATAVQTNLAGFDRILDILAEPREFQEDEARGKPLDRAGVQGRITLDRVSFAYPAQTSKVKGARAMEESKPGDKAAKRDESPRAVLRNISIDVPHGTTVALVGASGSGKTTLCNLIARFYDPCEVSIADEGITLPRGRILLDGVDLRDIDVRHYRRLLGIVEQDVFLFDGSVAENIAYGRIDSEGDGLPSREAVMRSVRAAAQAANAAEFIEKLEYGYDTIIGERGVRLSGGQKQRLAIARALFADPLILILDEATSNLDAESEAMIQRSLGGLMKGRTSFVIAHRLSTIRNADLIVVLEQGRVIETGNHETLLAAGGRYADLLRTQLEAHSPEAVAAIKEALSRG